MKNENNITINIIKYLYWQDIEKSNILPRILSYIFSTFLSFIFTVVLLDTPLNYPIRIFLSVYMIVNIFSYWPVQHYYSRDNLLKGTLTYIFMKFFIFISFFFLIKIASKNNYIQGD